MHDQQNIKYKLRVSSLDKAQIYPHIMLLYQLWSPSKLIYSGYQALSLLQLLTTEHSSFSGASSEERRAVHLHPPIHVGGVLN